MPYEFIRGLSDADLALADTEMPALARVIDDYRQYLPVETWNDFQARVAREWAIETGQIEGLYKFDRGLTVQLLDEGIRETLIPRTASEMSPEQVTAILNDHLGVLEGLFAFVKGGQPLTKNYIHQIHQALLRNQDTHEVYSALTGERFKTSLVTGRYKVRANSPTLPDGSTLEFCPPEHVESEMERLLALHAEHMEVGVPVELAAAWLHQAFTHIHPYPDGNGRVARALATIVLIKGGLMPLVPVLTERPRYISALSQADNGDFKELLACFRHWQRRLVIALGQRLVFQPQTTPEPQSIDQLLGLVQRDLLKAGLTTPGSWTASEKTMPRLKTLATSRLQRLVSELESVVRPDGAGWSFSFGSTSLEKTHLEPAGQLLDIALEPTLATSVAMLTGQQASLSFAFLTPSPRRGLKVAYLWYQSRNAQRVVGDEFLLTFGESEEDAASRFVAWLDRCLLEGLKLWRWENFAR
ncbi:hypothetical protein F183_A16720 [Bryobacterales bacterium F-183]|nr:hypothetical protein F183_A16720 [Bryobacterales bacterium F-183]